MPDPAPFPSEEDVDSVLAEFDGDARAAIRALLSDMDLLARDYECSVSHGFVRGDFPRLVIPRASR